MCEALPVTRSPSAIGALMDGLQDRPPPAGAHLLAEDGHVRGMCEALPVTRSLSAHRTTLLAMLEHKQ